jgi:hypothetical protein
MPESNSAGAGRMRTYVARFDNRSVQRVAVLTTGFASALWICGCAGAGKMHAPAGAATASSPAPAPVPTAAPTPPAPPAPAEPVVPARQAQAAVVAPTAASPVAAAVQSAVKAKKPAADVAPISKPAAATVLTQPTSPAPAPAAPLDLTALKQRLRDTNAIGVFTKLALKNQVDDLLDRFRQYYRGQVVSVVHNSDNDNVATCKDGHRYHVFLNADGRVVAQKQ